MRDILKVIGKYKWSILVVIILLLVQAYCNLSLPEYTSNIVNIGIANKGIDSIIPEVISKNNYNSVMMMLTDEEKNIVNKKYNCASNNGYKIQVCVLKDISSESKLELEGVILYPLFILSSTSDVNEYNINHVKKVKEEYKTNESFIYEKIIVYLQEEYKSIGIDVEKIQMSYIYNIGFKMIAITIFGLIITVISIYLTSKIASSFGRDLREALILKIMNFESEELNQFSLASLLTRTTNDIVQVQGTIVVMLRIVIFAPIIGIGASLKVLGNPLGWIIILAVVLILLLMLILFIFVVPKFKKFQDLLDKINLVSRETLTGLPVIRAYANTEYEEKKFSKVNDELTNNGLFITRAMAIMSPTLTFLMNSTSILIVFVGSKYVDNVSLQVGDLVAFISYTMQIITAFLMVSMVLIMMPRAIVSFKRIGEVFNTKSKITLKKDIISLKNPKGKIQFNNVSFKYPGSDEDAIKNINFEARPGTITAFIGSTGSGKSTLINLIPRLFDVTSGSIKIDGIDIRDMNINSLREIISYVPQKGWLTSGSIETNVVFGSDILDSDRVNNALHMSEALEFVNEKENKLQSEISSGGTNVSGGQRQRLAIARALYKDAPIYIFDDSFSALDYKTEANIRKSLKENLSDKTILLVASRISSVMHADQIIVLNDGQVVGIGTHKELLKSCPIYKEIKISQIGEDE